MFLTTGLLCNPPRHKGVSNNGTASITVSSTQRTARMREKPGCAARLGVVAQVKVVTDQAAAYLQVLEQVLPRAWHRIEQDGHRRARLHSEHSPRP
jgi:hypothetical protein